MLSITVLVNDLFNKKFMVFFLQHSPASKYTMLDWAMWDSDTDFKKLLVEINQFMSVDTYKLKVI